MSRKSRFNVTEWALVTRPKPTQTCQTCSMPEVVEAINEAEALRQAGKAHYPDTALLEMLQREFKYPYEESALRKHLRRCIGKEAKQTVHQKQGREVGRGKRGG